ncbi:MAG: ribbon-helix-helix domain-containing protein [Candidatus Zixiibacteriota bacterium]
MRKQKSEIITFKVDTSLAEAISHVSNRSEFIRMAVLNALENTCPLCGGTGILTPDQKKHWDRLATDHKIVECEECHENYLVCKKM